MPRQRPRRRAPDLEEGRARVILSALSPEIDGGRFPIKRVVGEDVIVEVDAFVDGHDVIGVALLYRRADDPEWSETPMAPLGNDRWRAKLAPSEAGRWLYTVIAWVDRFETWRRDLKKRVAAGQDVGVDLLVGAELLREAASNASATDAKRIHAGIRAISGDKAPTGQADRVAAAVDPELAAVVARSLDRRFLTPWGRELEIVVDRLRARFSAWYEMFPRSVGTFADVERVLPYVRDMGFDVLYLPPIHPIGRTKRKGRNNAVSAEPGDVGSPWAIGGPEGGHKSIHPDLGTLDDFRRLVAAAEAHGVEIAMDVAMQCSPDHPYVANHPEWFRHRPDGTIQYAENPPKRYEDIVPFDFECADWQALWAELLSIFEHWIEQGVRIFRVDNPHTKSLRFWEWCIAELKREAPDVLFLSEAFTRPAVMYGLAKRGFTWSYTYFPWKNTKQELRRYFEETHRPPVADFFRANSWPNTPDILPESLQHGGRPAHALRATLAATLSASWGIYGPAFELFEATPARPGSEEYLDSEKYERRAWDRDRRDSLAPFLARLNRIRRDNPALQRDRNLVFHDTDDDRLIAYSKVCDEPSNAILCVVNLDPHHKVGGHVRLDLEALGVDPEASFQVHDLLSDARFVWNGPRNFVECDPAFAPGHVFVIRRRLRTERDFEYFL